MKDQLNAIIGQNHLGVPKAIYDRDFVESVVGDLAGETEERWLVNCSHFIAPPASDAQIIAAEESLGMQIPSAYKSFLSIANGARLFVVPRARILAGEPAYVRHRVFGCDELVQINRELLRSFLSVYSKDSAMKHVTRLNYLAVCDGGDGNYQSILLQDDRVFMLFRELLYRPYDSRDADWYYTIASDFGAWLRMINHSMGWEGRGEQDSGL